MVPLIAADVQNLRSQAGDAPGPAVTYRAPRWWAEHAGDPCPRCMGPAGEGLARTREAARAAGDAAAARDAQGCSPCEPATVAGHVTLWTLGPFTSSDDRWARSHVPVAIELPTARGRPLQGRAVQPSFAPLGLAGLATMARAGDRLAVTFDVAERTEASGRSVPFAVVATMELRRPSPRPGPRARPDGKARGTDEVGPYAVVATAAAEPIMVPPEPTGPEPEGATWLPRAPPGA